MFRVLFVCTGNVCRSPVAQGLLRHWLDRDLVPDVLVESAGTYAQDRLPASKLAVEVARAEGIDISRHRSRLLHRDLIEEADLVLAMEAAHVYEVLRLAPGAEAKTHLLGAYNADERSDGVDMTIFDPIGGTEDDYRRSYAIIEHHLRRAYPAIRAEISAAARARREGS
jgi:protein-tyrosine phosphatase